MRHVLDDQGKLTVSLGIKEWFFIVAGIVSVTIYVFRLEMAVAKHEGQYVKAESTEVRQERVITNHGWRIARVERKVGVARRTEDRPEYDDEEYVGPEPYRRHTTERHR